MSLSDLIAAPNQRPGIQVLYGGTPIANVVSAAITRSFDQQATECRITTLTQPNVTPDSIHQITVGNGYSSTILRDFTGYVDDVVDGSFPHTWEIVCRDVLKKPINTWLDDVGVSYTDTLAENAVADLLSRAGLSVNAGSTNFTIGDVKPAEFKLISVMDAAMQIAALIGWHIWAGQDGTVYFQKIKPVPTDSPYWTYTVGTDVLKYKRTITDRNLRNRIVVLGYDNIRSVAYAGSDFVANPPGYNTAILSSELIDTQNMAQTVAGWMLQDLNHLTESVEFSVVGNPMLDVGRTIRFVDPTASIDNNYFLFSLNSRNDGSTGEYVTDLTIVRSEGETSVNFEPNPPTQYLTDSALPTGDLTPEDIATMLPGKGNLLYLSTWKGVAKCIGTYDYATIPGAEPPVWTAVNDGLNSVNAKKAYGFNLDPWSHSGDHFTAAYAMTADGFYRCEGLPDNALWTRILSLAQAATLLGAAEADTRIGYAFTPSVLKPGFVATMIGKYIGSWSGAQWFDYYFCYSLNNGQTWAISNSWWRIGGDSPGRLMCNVSAHIADTFYVSWMGSGWSADEWGDPQQAGVAFYRSTDMVNFVRAAAGGTGYKDDAGLPVWPYADADHHVYADDDRCYLGALIWQQGVDTLRRTSNLFNPLWSAGHVPTYVSVGSSDMPTTGGQLQNFMTLLINMFDENQMIAWNLNGAAGQYNGYWRSTDGAATWVAHPWPTVDGRAFRPVSAFSPPADVDVLLMAGSNATGSGVSMMIITTDDGETYSDFSLQGQAGALDDVLGLTINDAIGNVVVDYFKE